MLISPGDVPAARAAGFHFLGVGGGIQGFPPTLASIDNATAAMSPLLPPPVAPFTGLDMSPTTGKIYAGTDTPGGLLYNLNALGQPSGAPIPIIPPPFFPAISIVDMSFSPSGQLYAVTDPGFTGANYLVTINPQTGATANIANLQAANFGRGAQTIEFAPDGTLYAYTDLGPGPLAIQLARVNLTTGVFTNIGAPSPLPVYGLDSAPDGQMYGVDFDSFPPFSRHLFAVNLTTGAQSSVGSLTIPMHNIVSVPEPAGLALLATAGLLCWCWRRGNRAGRSTGS